MSRHKVRCRQCNACCKFTSAHPVTQSISRWDETSTTTHTARLECVSKLVEEVIFCWE